MQIAIEEGGSGALKIKGFDGAAVSKLTAKRRDQFPVVMRVLRRGVPRELATGATGIISVKKDGDFSSAPVALATEWRKTGLGTAATYTWTLSLNTTDVQTLFAAVEGKEPKKVSLRLEIAITEDGFLQTTEDIELEVANDYAREDDEDPTAVPDNKATQAEAEAGINNSKWMTPLRTKEAIDALAEGGGEASGVPYDLGNFGEGVTLSVNNGTLQRGVMVADTTISLAGVEGMEGKQLVLSFWTNGGAWTLNFSGVQMSAEAAALLPITLENSRSYVLKFGCVGYLWTLQEIYGPTLVD